MRRREFIAGIGGAATSSLLWPLAARAQQPAKQYRIAFVHSGIPADQLTETAGPFWVRQFYETLRGLGYAEGGNLIVERHSAEGRFERFASLAAAVVSRNPDVVLVNQNDFVKAFMAATATIPIVSITGDPIAGGLVTNLARPGGNLTGVSINAGIEIGAKRLQILKEAVPSAARIGHLLSGNWDAGSSGASCEEAALRLGVKLTQMMLAVVDEPRLQRTFADMAQQKLDAA